MLRYDARRGIFEEGPTARTVPEGDQQRVTPAECEVHPNGNFVYVSNRGHNSIAVMKIDQATGAPTLVEAFAPGGASPRSFNIDPTGRLLVAAPLWAIAVRDGNNITTMPAGLVLYRVGGDGKLAFARKYDIDADEKKQQFWAGMVTLA